MTSRPAALPVRERLTAMLAALAASALVLGACTVPGGIEPARPTAQGGTGTVAPELATYYGQTLTWSACQAGAQCATLTVPMDYANAASGQDITLSLLRVPARSQGQRLGSLVLNPGGPGGSGVDYAAAATLVVGDQTRRYYDVVGFDPRGVGRSTPIDCLTDAQLDTFLSTDPTPDDAAERDELLTQSKALAAGCQQRSPELMKHVSTLEAAKDMDVLRAALGDDQLNFLGKSYGTFLGATYAGLFPQRVGRFVLDGVLPPDLTSTEMAKGQVEGFERATRAYVQDCVQQGSCPLGKDVDAGVLALRELLASLDTDPLPSGDPAQPKLGDGWGSIGLAQGMYDQGGWALLTDAIRKAREGDGSGLMGWANTYASRDPGGRYESNMMEAMYAVNCLDRPDSPELSQYEANARDFETVAPTWGSFLAWGSLPCGVWPVKGGQPPQKIAAEGSNTIVVVGTTRDPATPYEWSERLRNQLSNATLLTMDGDGHTAYMRGNSCIDRAIDTYYVAGTAPQDGTTC